MHARANICTRFGNIYQLKHISSLRFHDEMAGESQFSFVYDEKQIADPRKDSSQVRHRPASTSLTSPSPSYLSSESSPLPSSPNSTRSTEPLSSSSPIVCVWSSWASFSGPSWHVSSRSVDLFCCIPKRPLCWLCPWGCHRTIIQQPTTRLHQCTPNRNRHVPHPHHYDSYLWRG